MRMGDDSSSIRTKAREPSIGSLHELKTKTVRVRDMGAGGAGGDQRGLPSLPIFYESVSNPHLFEVV